MKRNFWELPKKIWQRLSGLEPRRLWMELNNTQSELANTQSELANTQSELANTQSELANTQSELANTQSELANTQSELANTQDWNSPRDRRIHPFVAEALTLIANYQISKNAYREIPENYESPFTAFGSDKDTRHSYGPIYFEILNKYESPRILEIGVGSSNDFPYAGLSVGGALKGFRSKFPNGTIVGVDIDPYSIDAIIADGFLGYVVDQTRDHSLTENYLHLEKHGPYDLIIDDGFHDPHANVRTLKSFFSLLAPNGAYVIEDVHESLIDFWKVISTYLPGEMELTDMRNLRPDVDDNILLVIRKRDKSQE